MNDAQSSVWQRMFPWLERKRKKVDEDFVVRYRIDTANAMRTEFYSKDGKKLGEGYNIWANPTWAKLWTPYHAWRVARGLRRDKKIREFNERNS